METKSGQIIMLIGYPASGKSTIAHKYEKQTGFKIISRDQYGGSIESLTNIMDKLYSEGERGFILDNLNINKKSRKIFIEWGQSHNFSIYGIWINTTIEDSQIRALKRMWDKYGKIFNDGKLPIKDPNIFPISVLFKARKDFEEPNENEGFDKIYKIDAYKPIFDYANKGLFLDVDGTLRKTDQLPNKYPTSVDEVILLEDREIMRKKLQKYIDEGYILVGVSNQSGIGSGKVSEENVKKAMDRTIELLGIPIDIMYCPDRAYPPNSYCRKPQSGMGVYFIEKYKIDPRKSIMVGDRTEDKTFAERLGMKYIPTDKFWQI